LPALAERDIEAEAAEAVIEELAAQTMFVDGALSPEMLGTDQRNGIWKESSAPAPHRQPAALRRVQETVSFPLTPFASQ
jgi:hypothetical protein